MHDAWTGRTGRRLVGAPVAVQALPVPCLQSYALCLPSLATAVSQSSSALSRCRCSSRPVPALSRLTFEKLILLAWAWRRRRRLRLGLAILPLWCAISLSRPDSSDGLHERYYRNRGSSSCCEASRDHLNLAKIGGTGFALRATEPTPKVTLARGLPTEDGSASRPPRPRSVSRED